jgi:flagellin-specific chaperone FliS
MNYSISDKLLRLYDFIYAQLIKANGGKNADILEKLIPLAGSLRDAWKQAEGINRPKSSLKDKVI